MTLGLLFFGIIIAYTGGADVSKNAKKGTIKTLRTTGLNFRHHHRIRHITRSPQQLPELSDEYNNDYESDEDSSRDLIVGGSLVTSKLYGSFAVPDPNTSNGLCGATLIHPDILVSAAHCGASDIFIDGTIMNIGSTSIYGDDAIDRIEVVNQLIHPNFDINTLDYDIMLIQLASPSSAPVSSWNTDPFIPADSEALIVIGHGTTERSDASSVLREATVYVVGTETCDTAYDLNINGDLILCAGSDSSSACSGDSGGPLFRNQVLVGVVSFGNVNTNDGLCITALDFPNGYTRVSAVSDFLSQGICTLSANPPTTCFASIDPPTSTPTSLSPTTQAPVTDTPTKTPPQFTIFFPPITSSPNTPAPLLFSLFTSSPPSLSPSENPSVSPITRPSNWPSSVLSVSESPTIFVDQTLVPSEIPSLIPMIISSLPSKEWRNTSEASQSNENNITVIPLPTPKVDSNSSKNTTSATISDDGKGAMKNVTSSSKCWHCEFSLFSLAFGVLYRFWLVL
jgi:Trypsin